MAADLLAVLAMDPEQATAIVALGALPLLSALLNLQHSPGVCSLLGCPSHLLLHMARHQESARASYCFTCSFTAPDFPTPLLSLQLKSVCTACCVNGPEAASASCADA